MSGTSCPPCGAADEHQTKTSALLKHEDYLMMRFEYPSSQACVIPSCSCTVLEHTCMLFGAIACGAHLELAGTKANE